MCSLPGSVRIVVVDYFAISHVDCPLFARHILLLRDAVLAHALSRLRQLPQHVLPRHIPSAEHSSSNGEVGAIPPQPLPR
jgi:hypothetical protein